MDDDEFSMSSYDGDQGDSLVIKPPQAVVPRKEKRDRRDKRDRHKHKNEKHKEKHKSRDRRHDEGRRDHRRHRDSGKRENKKHRDRHEYEIMQINQEKKRNFEYDLTESLSSDTDERLFQKQFHKREKNNYPRGHHEGKNYYRKDREKRNDDGYGESSMSSQEKVEKNRIMNRFLQADKQKEAIQKEAEERRQKLEDRKLRELRHKALATHGRHSSMAKKVRRLSLSPVERKRKRHSPLEETVEISDDDHHNSSPEDVKMEEKETEEEDDHVSRKGHDSRKEKDNLNDKLSNVSSSEDSSESEDSDSSSSSSESEDENDEDESASDKETQSNSNKSESNSKKRSKSESASDSETASETSSSDEATSDEKEDSSIAVMPSNEKLPVYYPAIMGCRSVDEFECLNRIEEGTYGVVYRAREKSTNIIVALKRLKMEKEKEGFPITSLREVNTLLKGQHENIVTVREIVVGSNMDKIYIVMDYVEHDLKSLMEMMRQKKSSFTIGEVKTILMQLLKAVHHLHDNWILHRDLKTSNLLLSHKGILKVGDFGLAREYGSPLKQYTPIVVTLWYRAPELLLGTKLYSTPIDVWSVGCIFGELLSMEPMFPGKSEIDQLNKIFKMLGSPSERIWPGYNEFPVVKKTQFNDYPYNHLMERFKDDQLSEGGFDLLNKFLTYNPEKRITCQDALTHPYFVAETPAPVPPEMFPTWPAKSENPHGRKISSPKPPSGGKQFKELTTTDEEKIAGFFLGGAAPSGPGFTLKF